KYLYDAFGNTISKSGLLADANVYRFSSKEWHQNSGLVYYLYRYYDSNLQRWPNRDPLGELPGIQWELDDKPNLYELLYNNPVNLADLYGLGLFSYFECAYQVDKWAHRCLDGQPKCECMKTDQGYQYCLQQQKKWVLNCTANATKMMKQCLSATTSPPISKPSR
ncbi:MAG TPA: RHS repeat-associated core domain-containing protein, partial [Verrucomicrobiae bacterium]|nr:RHS repeat-associated core domain-containing protein [Verrucomicrobiae bacterium]